MLIVLFAVHLDVLYRDKIIKTVLLQPNLNLTTLFTWLSQYSVPTLPSGNHWYNVLKSVIQLGFLVSLLVFEVHVKSSLQFYNIVIKVQPVLISGVSVISVWSRLLGATCALVAVL